MKVEGKMVNDWFIGKQRHSIDDKNRVFIPSKFREKLGDKVYITKSLTEKCIRLYSADGFSKYIEETIDKLPKIEAGEKIAWLGANSEELNIDAQGRIALPSEYKEYASITKNVVSSGAFYYVCMWDENIFDSQEAENNINDLRKYIQSKE